MNAVTNASLFSGMSRLRYLIVSLPDAAAETMPLVKFPLTFIIAFDAVLMIGCYLFMWSVRHPKTE
jgi:hypothetical protein